MNTVIRSCGADFDSMEIQDALLRHKWDIEKTISYLQKLENAKNPNKRNYERNDEEEYSSYKANGASNGSNNHIVRKKVRKNSGSGDDARKPSERVFDSDDDDSENEEMTDVRMTKERKDVFEFLNNATLLELQSIKSCSLRKAETIIDLRPYCSWIDLVSSITYT